jgi:hypothetical protein
MLQDKTHKIKVYDSHDAVIYVYSRHTKQLNPEEKDLEKRKWKHWKEVIAVIPAHNYGDDYQDSSGEFQNNVKVTVDALAELYSSCYDYEVGVEYVMNTHQYVNV